MTDSFTADGAGARSNGAAAAAPNGAAAPAPFTGPGGPGGPDGAAGDPADLVGRVAGTEDSTPLQFAVALDEASYLQLDDVVVTLRHIPGVGPILTSGIVTQVRARHEGASFGSDVFLISDGVLPARVQEIAEVSTTRVEPEVYVPPRPGEIVRRASGPERAQALYFDQMATRLPVGRGRDGAPIYVNMEFLDGTRGAHVSISGISGVATKTSFALFLLHSIFRSGALGARAVNAKALVFSVKGEDLLFLDQPNVRLDDDLRAAVRRARAARGAVRVGRVLGAADPGRPDGPAERHRAHQRRGGVLVDDRRVLRRELLPYVFADAEDERQQYTIVIHQVAARLRQDAAPYGEQRRGEDRRRRRDDVRGPHRRHRGPADRRDDPRRLGRAGHRHGDGQRVRPAAALVAAAAAADHPRRPDAGRRGGRSPPRTSR